MITKRLYREEDDRMTPEGLDLDTDVGQALRPFFTTFIARGYSPREISHVICQATYMLEHEAILGWDKVEETKEGETCKT